MTPRQRRVLGFIADFIRDEGYSPSYDEIAAGLGYKAKSNVWRIVHRLRQEGHLSGLNGQSRSLQIANNDSKVIAAAERILDGIVSEDEEHDIVVVKAEPIAALDILLSEIRPKEARTSHNPLIDVPRPDADMGDQRDG